MSKAEKKFDAVAMMRSIRDGISAQIEGMTLQDARRRSLNRKVLEGFVSVILTSRASKDEILEMYLNDIPLGQRGSFAIVGVSEASRLFFGKDVSNVSLAEAATIAGVIQSPSALSPFNNPERCRERRNVVLSAMVDAGYIQAQMADRAAKEPLVVLQRALEAEAPHFVDFVGQTLDDDYPGLTTTTNRAVDVHTTLDLHLQRIAQDAVRSGLTNVDQLLARLSETDACGFEDLFTDGDGSRSFMIVTFLALLEMIRLKLIRIFQSRSFGAIRVYKRARPADAPHPIGDPQNP